MEKLKMAVVGTGTWGKTHISIYNEHPGAECVAVCDMNGERAKQAAEEYGIPGVYTDVAEMAAKSGCDAVAIATPDFLHTDIAVACAKAGKALLIEKPLATTKADCDAIMAAVKETGVRCMVDLHNRWNPPYNVAKQQVDQGGLGKPYSAYIRLNDERWVATDMLPWAAKSSILWFLGSHSVDTLRWMLNDEVKRVYSIKREGILKGLGVDTPDMYLTTLEFKNGAIAQMENGWITPNGNGNVNDFKFTMLCERGKVDIDASSHGMLRIADDKAAMTPDVLVNHFVFGKCNGFAYESIRDFVDRMLDDGPFRVSMEDAYNTSMIILAIMESAEKGRPVDVTL